MEEAFGDYLQSATPDEYTAGEGPYEEDRDASNWVEYSSDNGDKYFAHVVTGETSWTKPGSTYDSVKGAADNVAERNTATDPWEAAQIPVDDAPNEAGQATQWLELYDPDQSAVFFFAPQSGEVRWEPPLIVADVVGRCDNEAVLRAVVSLQSATRSQQARTRVMAMRQQKMRRNQPKIDKERNYYTDENADDIRAETVQSSTFEPASESVDSRWVEVYDPATQQQYYYSPYTSERPWSSSEALISSSDDRKVAAAISIQSLSRGRMARKQVGKLQAHGKEHPFEEDESEREGTCRREMNRQELLQLQGGDRFWGLDIYEREVVHKHLEDELMARTKALNTQNISTSSQQTHVLSIPVDYQDFEEEEIDPDRLQREQQEEHSARIAMCHEEARQCQNGDSFWGIQAEEARQDSAIFAMTQEEAASRRFAENVLEQALGAAWEAEVLQNATKELAARGGQEQRMQARYLCWFYQQCVSVDELLGYRWPTKQQQECLSEAQSPVKRRRDPAIHLCPESVASATPYLLDDLIFRERLENGDLRYGLRSILTVHHKNTQGRSGTHFEITKASSDCAFDAATAAILVGTQMLSSTFDQRMNGDDDDGGSQDGELTAGSSVNYRRSQIPDPRVPARFNGVPYKPNQISSTREILSGAHRKLTQLPSLANPKPSAEIPTIRQLQKAKTRARTKSNWPSGHAPQLSNNRYGSESAREPEVDRNLDPEGGDLHAQFKRQEHQVLLKLFSLMDLDGSGTVNQDEMRWALQRDAEIHTLAKTSPLLRILLKQRTRLEALFSNRGNGEQFNSKMNEADRSESSNELSWGEFLARCEHSYLDLMSEGLIQLDVVASAARSENSSCGALNKAAADTKKTHLGEYPEPSARETEAQTIRRVFVLLDIDHNGVVDVAEVQRALYNSAATTLKSAAGSGAVSKELHALVEGSRSLQPMLHQKLFMTAFTKFEPMDPRGISEEEFVAFCLEIAQVAAANSMVEV